MNSLTPLFDHFSILDGYSNTVFLRYRRRLLLFEFSNRMVHILINTHVFMCAHLTVRVLADQPLSSQS